MGGLYWILAGPRSVASSRIHGYQIHDIVRYHRRILPTHLLVSGRRAPHIRDTDPPLHRQTDDELLESISKLQGTPPEILAQPELLRLRLPVLRADFQLGETYEYIDDAPLACPITAFGGDEDKETLDGRLDGWRQHTTTAFSRHLLRGGHFFMQSEEQALIALVRDALTRAR